MIKNWKTATLWGALLWILIFTEISIVIFVPTVTELMQKLLHLIMFLPIFVVFCSYMYFKDLRKSTVKDGLALGVYFVAVGLILDLFITVQLFVPFLELYTDWSLWAGVAETIIFSGLVAKYR